MEEQNQPAYLVKLEALRSKKESLLYELYRVMRDIDCIGFDIKNETRNPKPE